MGTGTIIGLLLIAAVLVLLLVSLLYRRIQLSALDRPLKAAAPPSRTPTENSATSDIAVSSVTLFDVLYNTTRLDPFVLAGIDHLHHAQHFDNLRDVIAYMREKIILSDDGPAAWERMVHKYKGYAGEQQVFAHLRGAGHEVVVPDSGVTPGYDAHVDGYPVDVKVHSHPFAIHEHLAQHPDIAVVANRELADAFVDQPNVTIDPDLSAVEMADATDATLDGIGSLGDWLDCLPLIPLATSSIHNVVAVRKGRKSVRTAVEHVAVDTASAGVGTLVGAKIGLFAGLILAPATGGTSAVIIPAATSLIGTFLGKRSGGRVGRWVKGRHVRSAEEEITKEASTFADAFRTRVRDIQGQARRLAIGRAKKFEFARRCTSGRLRRTFFPSTMATFYSRAAKRATVDGEALCALYTAAEQRTSTSEPKDAGLLLYAQGADVWAPDSALLDHWMRLDSLMNVLRAEQQKLA